MPERLASDKHFGLFGSFISYVGNEVLLIPPQGAYSQYITYEWIQIS